MEYERGRADARREIEELGGELGAAYERGVQDERRRAIAARGQLKSSWGARAVRTYEEVVAERIRAMEARAVQVVQTEDWPAITMPGTGGR